MVEPSQLAAFIQPVARALLGEPNRSLSSKTEWRYGNHGSLSVDLQKGTWFDHEANEGGGTLDLIERETGLHEAERFEWLEKNTDYQNSKPNGRDKASLGVVVATYPYVDEAGTYLFEVVKFDPKDFRQRRTDPSKPDGWDWSIRGVKRVPYRLPELIEAVANEHTVFVVEGEKDVDNLYRIGVPATTNPGGAGKWREELNQYFEGADVIVIQDNDPQKKHPKTSELMFHDDGRPILPGQDHAQDVARRLSAVAARVRVLDLSVSWPQMPLKGDTSDWLKAGGNAGLLYALADDLPDWSPPAQTAADEIPIVYPYPIIGEQIPLRPWQIVGLLLCGQVTALYAPPASGKSLLTLQLGIACAAGVEWNGWRPRGRYRVLVINSEEDEQEQRRRLYAARKKMEIGEELLGGFAFAQQPESIVVAKADSRTKTVTRTPMLERIVTTIIAQKINIVIVDPFAETFEGDENSNSELKWAAVLWREVARRANCSIFLIHHTKKYAHDMAGDPDAGRGGGALTGVARIVSTLFTMSASEAEEYDINPEDRIKYIRFDDAKANLTLIGYGARWFKKESVTLPNGDENHPADEVGVLVPWKPPDPFGSTSEVNQILNEIEKGVIGEDGRPTGDFYTLKKSERWAVPVVQRFRQCSEDMARKILQRWIKNGFLEEIEAPTQKSKGAKRKGLKVIGHPSMIEERV